MSKRKRHKHRVEGVNKRAAVTKKYLVWRGDELPWLYLRASFANPTDGGISFHWGPKAKAVRFDSKEEAESLVQAVIQYRELTGQINMTEPSVVDDDDE